MRNAHIAAAFEELADLLEIQAANPFRVRAYRTAARTIASLPEPAADVVADPVRDLSAVKGIGKDLAAKVAELVGTGRLAALDEARDAVPEGVRRWLRIDGLGPKKAGVLHRELGVGTPDELRAAAADGRVAGLKGFGKKTAESILAGLDTLTAGPERRRLADVLPLAELLAEHLRSAAPGTRCEVAGSARRRCETVGDLDLLAAPPGDGDPSAAADALAAHPAVDAVLSRGPSNMRVRLVPPDAGVGGADSLELDLRTVRPGEWGSALVHFTGSAAHNLVLRRRARDRGSELSEYGLTPPDDPAGATPFAEEADLYAALGLPWIPPELREDRGEFGLAGRDALPHLVSVEDMIGDLHMHTTASDGKGTIREMAEAARALGREYVVITDHSPRVTVANGLGPDRLRAHWAEIDRVNASLDGITVLKGVECDILEDAALDLPDDVLADADWVVGVLHFGLKQPRAQIMKRLTAALESPHVDAIGHPSGRIIGRRPPADIDWPAFLDRAAATGTLLEINASPKRLDLSDVHARAAADRGIPIVIDTDAHSPAGLAAMRWGVYQARRAGLTAADVANTRPWEALRGLLK